MATSIQEETTGCLSADQSCFALSRMSRSHGSSRACCSTASYLEVLGISLGSLAFVLLLLCAIRCCLVRRARRAPGAEADAAGGKKRPPGLGAEAIAALPEFEYRGKEGRDAWECSVCLSAVADGEVVRQLPRCTHVFHQACVDAWLRENTTCPVCRAEVVKPAGDEDAEKVAEGGPPQPPATVRLEDVERDLEAQ